MSSAGNDGRESGGKALTKPGSTPAPITARSFDAMQTRALRIFQQSVEGLQALTDDDFAEIAAMNPFLSSAKPIGVAKIAHTYSGANSENVTPPEKTGDSGIHGQGDDGEQAKASDEEQERNPTPSLSAVSRPQRLPLRESRNNSDTVGDCIDEYSRHVEDGRDSQKVAQSLPTGGDGDTGDASPTRKLSMSSATPTTATTTITARACLRVLRAVLLVLGGCGLGALPSDKELWRAVRPMLLDGSLRHRIRHFDR